MKIKLIISFLLLIFCYSGFTQNIDLLKKEVEEASSWQEKLDLYLEMADTLMWVGNDIEQSKKYAELVLDICENQNCGDKKAIARAIVTEFGLNQGDYAMLDEVIFPSLQLNDFEQSSTRSYYEELAGIYYFVNGNTNKSLQYLTKAQQTLEKDKPNSKRLTSIYLYVAYAHNMNASNDSSILFMEKSIAHAKLSNDTLKICDGLIGLNTLYSNDGNYSEAIKTLLKAKELLENTEIGQSQMYTISDALIHNYIKNKYYNKAENELKVIIPEYRKTTGSIKEKASTIWSYFMSYSLLMKKTKRYKEGLEYVDSAYIYAEHLNDFSILITDLRQAAPTESRTKCRSILDRKCLRIANGPYKCKLCVNPKRLNKNNLCLYNQTIQLAISKLFGKLET